MRLSLIIGLTLILSFLAVNVGDAERRITPTYYIAHQVFKLESGGKHEGVWGDNGKAFGIAQFHKRTFLCLAKKAGRPNLDWKNAGDQIFLTMWAIDNGYGAEWTAYRKITGITERKLCKYDS